MSAFRPYVAGAPRNSRKTHTKRVDCILLRHLPSIHDCLSEQNLSPQCLKELTLNGETSFLIESAWIPGVVLRSLVLRARGHLSVCCVDG